MPGLPPAFGAAVAKELRYLLRAGDIRLGLGLGVGVAILLLVHSDPLSWLVWLGILIVVIPGLAAPHNCFGLDRGGTDRYRLFPLSGRQVLASKNLAYLLVITLQLLPLTLATVLRMGGITGVAALLGGLAYAVWNLCWGNFASVRAPSPRGFQGLDAGEQSGGILSGLYTLAVGIALLWVAILAADHGPAILCLTMAASLALAAALYRALLPLAARAFDREADAMRARLAG